MIIGRIIGWILMAAALAALGYEAFVAIDTGAWRVLALGEIWFKVDSQSLNAAQAGIQRHVSPYLWEPVITTVLLWPGWAVFGVPAVLLMLLFRVRRRRHRQRIS
jgi:hypothetical protein